jgi:hypothetical protein
MRLIRIESNLIEAIWKYVEDLLEKPVELNLGEFTLEDIKDRLLKNDMQLWIAASTSEKILAAGVSEVVVYPREKRLRMVLVGARENRLDEWIDVIFEPESPMLEWCRKNGIKRMESTGRDGWTKVLRDYGFKKYYTVLTKDV